MDLLDLITRLAVSFLPVLMFLLTLVYLDSYKLLTLNRVATTIAVGAAVAAVCLPLNNMIMMAFDLPPRLLARYGAPVVEETLKAAYVFWLIRRGRVGFMVDAAISGFAIGAGFAIVENTYYLNRLVDRDLIVWILRGFGTAVMHGGMTAIVAIVSKSLFDRTESRSTLVFVPGLMLAVALHSAYNHFILSPVVATLVLHVSLPLIILGVFYQSERATKHWLGSQMDVETELLAIINDGKVTESHIGQYLRTLRDQFPAETVFDMMCYLKLHIELAISAKGILMMREAGFNTPPPAETEDKFNELRHLERTIGRTGLLTIQPFLHSSSRDLWQLHMLGK